MASKLKVRNVAGFSMAFLPKGTPGAFKGKIVTRGGGGGSSSSGSSGGSAGGGLGGGGEIDIDLQNQINTVLNRISGIKKGSLDEQGDIERQKLNLIFRQQEETFRQERGRLAREGRRKSADILGRAAGLGVGKSSLAKSGAASVRSRLSGELQDVSQQQQFAKESTDLGFRQIEIDAFNRQRQQALTDLSALSSVVTNTSQAQQLREAIANLGSNLSIGGSAFSGGNSGGVRIGDLSKNLS